MEKCLSGAKFNPGQTGKGIRKTDKTAEKKAETETVLIKHWLDSTTTDQSVLKEFLGGRSPKWHPGHPVLLPGVLGAGWAGAWGEEEEANQGVLEPKGFSMSLQSSVTCRLTASPRSGPRHLGRANSSADNTEIAACLNSWQAVGKVTLFCTMPRDKGLVI